MGSEIFNQLVICAGAVFAAKSGSLELDRAIVTREVCFYAISIGLLWYVLHDVEPIDGEEHIFISFFDSCLLVSAYIAYVFVCANFEPIVKLFSCKVAEDDDSESVRVRKWSRNASISCLRLNLHNTHSISRFVPAQFKANRHQSSGTYSIRQGWHRRSCR